MRLNFYNGFYGNASGMQCDMEGFILQYGNEENLTNLTLNFPADGPVIPGDNFVPQGNFSIIPPAKGIKCGGPDGDYIINFNPLDFSGPPEEPVVRYISN